VKAERGTLDIVFANAGVGSQLKLGEVTAEQIDQTFAVNVKGTIFKIQKALLVCTWRLSPQPRLAEIDAGSAGSGRELPA
jgi:NAD(P)-dependent dehydrogenase (short-subunit alcohol dehydrogenase family)